MATKADSAGALRKSLIPPGADLPPGWGLPFRSQPCGSNRSRWYVVAPYSVLDLQDWCRQAGLEQTVFADSYKELWQKVWTQHSEYERLTAS